MIELEMENFRVDSTGWRKFIDNQGIIYLENSNKDIQEYVGAGNKIDPMFVHGLVGEQLFTLPAAIRETKKAGKRIPNLQEWKISIRNVTPKHYCLKWIFHNGLPSGELLHAGRCLDLIDNYPGRFSKYNGFVDFAEQAMFWALSTDNNSWVFYMFYDSPAYVYYRRYSQAQDLLGLSVRCLKN